MKYSEQQNKASYRRNAWWFEPGRRHGHAPGWDTVRDEAPQPSASPPHWKTQEHAPTVVIYNGLWSNQALELPLHTEKYRSIHSLWLNQALELPIHVKIHTGIHPAVVTCHNLWSNQALELPPHNEKHMNIHSLWLNQALELPLHVERHTGIHPTVVTCHSLWSNQALELPLHNEKHKSIHPTVVTCHSLRLNQALEFPLHTEKHKSIHPTVVTCQSMVKSSLGASPLHLKTCAYTPLLSHDDNDDCFWTALFSTLEQTHLFLLRILLLGLPALAVERIGLCQLGLGPEEHFPGWISLVWGLKEHCRDLSPSSVLQLGTSSLH